MRVLLLGQGRLELDGQALTRLLAPKQQALLFYLAAVGGPVARTKLASMLWSELDDASARSNLRGALSRLRRWLPELLLVDAQHIGLAPGAALEVDLHSLSRAMSTPDMAPAARCGAADAWRGPVLDGFEVTGAEGFEEWLAQARPRAQRELQLLRHDLLRRSEAAGALDEAASQARSLLDVDDADEAAHMALMRLLAATGRRTAAIAQYEACRAALLQRLGARPSAECYALYTRIHSDAAAPKAERAPPSACVAPSDALAAGNVANTPPLAGPSAPDLIGRDAEFELACERLSDPACRWLTITGPGGVGKTRLAQSTASAWAPRCRHGVLWLSGRVDGGGALQDAESLIQQIVARTGADRHAAGALLLVLDNLEKVPAARGFEPMLRERAPGVKVLATSRVRVGGGQEWLLELGGLGLAPAARLFGAAARRLVPDFDADAQSESVERICRLVGGLPLALQMAARSVHTAGVAPVLEHLDKGDPLIDDDREEADQHRSLDAVLEDSWSMLDDEARDTALRLSQLPGDFDAELARVIGASDAALATLRAHSWLTRSGDAQGDGRLGFHPLLLAWLRRHASESVASLTVMEQVVHWLDERMPPVSPFSDLAAGDEEAAVRAMTLAGSASASAPTLMAAARLVGTSLQPSRAADWTDRAVAMLLHADRQAEATSLLAQALMNHDLPRWQHVGWGLRRAELLNGCGASRAALRGYIHALAELGLCNADIEQTPWADLVPAARRLLALEDWPAHEPARAAFSALVLRSLYCTMGLLVFSPDQRPLMRISLEADVLFRRLRLHGGLRVGSSALAVSTAGHPALARRLVARAQKLQASAPATDPRVSALFSESRCVVLFGLGDWDGLPQELEASAQQFARLRCGRQEMNMRALSAKLAFFEGRLDEALRRFHELDELALRRPGESWRAWGPIGLVEVGLCLEPIDDDMLRGHYERAVLAMTEMENIDAAYTMRRLGLAARLAWRSGDLAAARAAVHTGVAAARRMQSAWWAHEGYAGVGDTLLALGAHEASSSGEQGLLDEAWRAFEPALALHVRRFPPAVILQLRLQGARAKAQGRVEEGNALLKQAIAHAERQGMRVELARACRAVEAAPPDPNQAACAGSGSHWGRRI
ncbi:BTAD domain-containing putative transcriptional regulator [Variovorax sp. J22R133]|uniref:AfsR/SARP family transcriptional regulator n=1 Tax=Variovorax brevis TaxID=3053503 RepID=UPI0025770215|nr:BTAD domain-containing putative transcriptional regulator [Variovorax sp. J22R133]MDM0111301.1 BTAD domain-containing putative transcriptional regulator [Variovorax sp. J22R133]